eukprot:m.18140 g.18140  ORF g.18140 m.18140 type:complete len:445 (-) comp10761_c0_seq1:43-1377(-)
MMFNCCNAAGLTFLYLLSSTASSPLLDRMHELNQQQTVVNRNLINAGEDWPKHVFGILTHDRMDELKLAMNSVCSGFDQPEEHLVLVVTDRYIPTEYLNLNVSCVPYVVLQFPFSAQLYPDMFPGNLSYDNCNPAFVPSSKLPLCRRRQLQNKPARMKVGLAKSSVAWLFGVVLNRQLDVLRNWEEGYFIFSDDDLIFAPDLGLTLDRAINLSETCHCAKMVALHRRYHIDKLLKSNYAYHKTAHDTLGTTASFRIGPNAPGIASGSPWAIHSSLSPAIGAAIRSYCTKDDAAIDNTFRCCLHEYHQCMLQPYRGRSAHLGGCHAGLHYNPTGSDETGEQCLLRKMAEAREYFDTTRELASKEGLDEDGWLQPNRCAVLNSAGKAIDSLAATKCTRPKHDAYYDKRDQAVCLLGWEQGFALAALTMNDVEERAKALMATGTGDG